jgi:membrane protease YdiL (CAAX protease family)
MSLRVFHIVFVIVCIALSLWVGVWGIHDYMQERSIGALALAIVFLLSGLVLVLYGRRAFEKLRDLP